MTPLTDRSQARVRTHKTSMQVCISFFIYFLCDCILGVPIFTLGLSVFGWPAEIETGDLACEGQARQPLRYRTVHYTLLSHAALH
jgi:hypothetical protein